MGNIHEVRNAISTDRYRAAVAKLIADFQPDLFVTLAFNASTTIAAAVKRLSHFHACIDHHLLGSRWQRLEHRRTRYIAVIEHPDSNLHIHVALAVPEERAAQVARLVADRWSLMVPSGSVNVQPVVDPIGLGGYLAKAIQPAHSDCLLISQNAGVIRPAS
jgi:hypothetical protein